MYEKLQIESLLQDPRTKPQRAMGLFLMSKSRPAHRIFDLAVVPAMLKNDIEMLPISIAFDSSSMLSEVTRWLRAAEVIVADLSEDNPDLLYVLGLAHGMGRCPLLTVRSTVELPFNLSALRYVEYENDSDANLLALRDHLTRAVRVFLTATRAEK
jgi:hypothetical protein